MRVAIDGRLLPNQPANLHVFYHGHTKKDVAMARKIMQATGLRESCRRHDDGTWAYSYRILGR